MDTEANAEAVHTEQDIMVEDSEQQLLNGSIPINGDVESLPAESKSALPSAPHSPFPEEDQKPPATDVKPEPPSHDATPGAPEPPRAPDGPYRTKYIMSGHKRSVSSVKFSPDGAMLASCCELSLVNRGGILDLEVAGRQPRISSLSYGISRRASLLSLWRDIRRVSPTLHGRTIARISLLPQTIRQFEYGTWNP